MATPIINFPEVGILGVHKIEQRPAVVDGQIVARWLMNLSISLDHRLVDGWDGAMFLQDVKALLEDPTLMFMEMVSSGAFEPRPRAATPRGRHLWSLPSAASRRRRPAGRRTPISTGAASEDQGARAVRA